MAGRLPGWSNRQRARWPGARQVACVSASLLFVVVSCTCRTTGQEPGPPPGSRHGSAGSIATLVIGPAGGAVVLPGGAKVVVPHGAFQVPTTISIREVPAPPNVQFPAGTVRVGAFYAIEPRLTPSQPIAVTLPYDPTLIPHGYDEGSVSVYQLRANGRLSMVG